jgi:hypothetical protein
MAVLTKTHPNEDAARRVVGARRVAAEPRADIWPLMERPLWDISQAVGGFAGPVRPDAPVGAYSGHIRRRYHAAGSFATGVFAGNTNRQRKGSFGDIDRAVTVAHKDHTERARVRRQDRVRGARASGRGRSEGERDARVRLARDAS